VDEIPVDRFVRPGVSIDISHRCDTNEDYRLTRADVEDYEARHGPVPDGAIVLVATGWDRRWPGNGYLNIRDGVKHFPGIGPDAARFLAQERRCVALGIDTASVDHGASVESETHHVTLPLGLYHIENVANLTRLPPRGFTIVVAPINVVGGSGGPARVFAILEHAAR
jgi:kynurenine formamidase